MPNYIDRHTVPVGTSLTDILQLHEKDLAVEGKHHCKCRTFWLDEERGIVNCLIQAPDKETIMTLHGEAHGQLPSEIMEVQPELVMAFLGRLEDLHDVPPASRDYASAFRTVMFTDLKDSTAMTSRLGDARAMELLRIHDGIIRKALDAWHGREVKHTGDGLMLSFCHAPDALACAVSIQRSFAEYNASSPEVELRVRVGLAAGEPVAEGKDLFGGTVQQAARICAQAQPDQILISEQVQELCTAWHSSLADQGEASLKGFDHPVKVFAVDWSMA